MEAAVLVVAAVAAGITGAWSPCGFSMVDTLGPQGYAGRLRTTLLACATFAAGALAGGIATFAGLSALGRALGAGGAAAAAVAAVIALAAALGEARGTRIVPQVRRQVPESWRRVLPVPLAAGLYGILLGLGFTTFILSFAVWALAGVSVALGDPHLGLLIGLGFGAGRTLPVIVLAPAARTEWGADAHAAMAERPRILRALRAADAVALAACAAALLAAPAQAATIFAQPATDPSADGGLLAFQRPGGSGVLAQGKRRDAAPGAHPAVGGGLLAYLDAGGVQVRSRTDPAYALTLPATGADAVAVSAGWVAWRQREGSTDVLVASPLPPAAPAPRRVASAGSPAQLGRPSLDASRLLFHVAGRSSSRIVQIDLPTGKRATLRTQARALLLNPSALGGKLLYVRSTYQRQQLLLGRLAPASTSGDRALFGIVPTGWRDAGYEPGAEHHKHGYPMKMPPRPKLGVHDTLWSTALTAGAAYVTRLRQLAGHPVRATLLRVSR
ncbi:MAG: hypothetical protein QOE28_1192 [Solirubrobacteraceae bacterium]|nr:hypothetical protein [Solirubrobacteraceae bacterium]